MKKIIKNVYLKIYKHTIGKINYIRLKNKKITIISNNCWGGVFYRDNNLEYLSPTLGLFFMADEYIKFIYNLKHYINTDLHFISIEESKYCDYLKKLNYKSPIGKIDDVEICFLHYKTEDEAYEKWTRRKKRILYNKIIYKFSDQNGCLMSHLERFNQFDAKNKILFTTQKYKNIDSIQIKKYENNECVVDDIKSYKKYFDAVNFINNMK